MKKIFLIVIVAIVLLGGGFYALNSYIYHEKQGEEIDGENGGMDDGAGGEEETSSPVVAYFQAQMIARGIKNAGQPIEGFDAMMLMRAFPGLVASDFRGVEALEGYYEVRGDVAVFVRAGAQPMSSAEGMVLEKGYGTLLKNLSTRLGLSVTSNARADALIQKISVSDRLEARIGTEVSALGATITPREVTQDSRCPLDVVCIQAGTVRVRAMFEYVSGAGEQVFELGKPIVAGDVTVTLVEVLPAARSTVTLLPSDYRFYFKVEKQ